VCHFDNLDHWTIDPTLTVIGLRQSICLLLILFHVISSQRMSISVSCKTVVSVGEIMSAHALVFFIGTTAPVGPGLPP
jgi:hypothetical protein